MHDRRLDGEVQKFGNNGALFMNAMTWWDWDTASVWSQPWGLAIDGVRRGDRLRQLPMSLVSWGEWKVDHAESLVLKDDQFFPASRFLGEAEFQTNFVIGIALGDDARSFPFPLLQEEAVVNDFVGDFPVVLHVPPGTQNARAFIRRLGDQVFTFVAEDKRLRDLETGSLWDTRRGIAIEGPLTGEGLQRAPIASAFDWAWLDFYTRSTEYQGRNAE